MSVSMAQPNDINAQVSSYLNHGAAGNYHLSYNPMVGVKADPKSFSHAVTLIRTDDQEIDKAHALIDHTGHGIGRLEGIGADSLIKNSAMVLNPCARHPLNEI